MKQTKSWLSVSLFFLSAVALFSACNKLDATELGTDLIPAVDNVSTFETVLFVEANNEFTNDSSFVGPTRDYILGTISNDPLFGKTTASILLQFKPNSFGSYPFVNARDSIVAVDSVVLSLSYRGSFGDTNVLQRVRVFEVDPTTGPFYIDTLTSVPYPPTTADVTSGNGQVDIRTLNDSARIKLGPDTVSVVNQLRIKLDTTLVGKKLIDFTTDNAYRSDSAFNVFNKGFVIVTDSSFGSNALMYFNPSQENTNLRVFYKVLRNGRLDTTFTTFSFGTNGFHAHANLIRRDYSGSPALTYLSNGNTADDLLYLQTSPNGTKGMLRIPGLDTLSSNVLIHRAELIMEQVDDPSDQLFPEPQSLYLDALDTSGRYSAIIDPRFYSSGSPDFSLVGGFRRTTRDLQGNLTRSYQFDVTRYVQYIASRGRNNLVLRVTAPLFAFNSFSIFNYDPQFNFNLSVPGVSLNNLAAGRVRLGGGNHPVKKMRVRIVYSKI